MNIQFIQAGQKFFDLPNAGAKPAQPILNEYAISVYAMHANTGKSAAETLATRLEYFVPAATHRVAGFIATKQVHW